MKSAITEEARNALYTDNLLCSFVSPILEIKFGSACRNDEYRLLTTRFNSKIATTKIIMKGEQRPFKIE